MEHDETGCQPAPEGPILCVKNCGFFGSAANMNMCSKCYKDMVLKQEQAKLAASSIENFVNGSSSSSGNGKDPIVVATQTVAVDVQIDNLSAGVKEEKIALVSVPTLSNDLGCSANEPKPIKEGPSRCATCKKRVGLTGFKCRCGDLFCGSHRYSDKHNCQFDYRAAAQEAISKANPVVKAEKLDKI